MSNNKQLEAYHSKVLNDVTVITPNLDTEIMWAEPEQRAEYNQFLNQFQYLASCVPKEQWLQSHRLTWKSQRQALDLSPPLILLVQHIPEIEM